MTEATEQGHGAGRKVFYAVWISLVVLTGLEVLLAYQHLETKVMLGMLMCLSIIKASLIIAYFMHLRYEKRSLALTLMPALVWVVGMMFVFFPDSLRLYQMHPK